MTTAVATLVRTFVPPTTPAKPVVPVTQPSRPQPSFFDALLRSLSAFCV